MNIYTDMIRPAARQALSTLLPGPGPDAACVAVLGLPRSGTSWVAKTLSLGDSVTYYFEPDYYLPPEYWYRYLPADGTDSGLKAFMDRTFRGGVHGEYSIAEQGVAEILRRRRAATVLVKWVKHVMAADWILHQYPALRLVQVIRHPVPLALSWQQRGWDIGYNLDILLRQEELMNTVLADFREMMSGADTYWEKVGCFWGAVAHLQYRAHLRHGQRSILREHEWFCRDPVPRFRWLCGQIGIPFSTAAERFLTASGGQTRGPGYGRPRDSAGEIHKWSGRVEPGALDALREVLQAFDLPFYPDLDPDASWC